MFFYENVVCVQLPLPPLPFLFSPRLTWGDTLGGAGVVVVVRGCEGCEGESKKEKSRKLEMAEPRGK